MATHASSLTSLRLTHTLLCSLLHTGKLSLPRLRYLHYPRDWAPALAPMVPHLQELGLTCLWDVTKPRDLPVPLVDLETGEYPAIFRNLKEYLPPLIRSLHTLGVPALAGLELGVLPLVHTLKVGALAPTERLAELFPSLTSLTVQSPLPCGELAALAGSLAGQGLNLRTLQVALVAKTAERAAVRALGDSLCKLEARGVLSVRIAADGGCKAVRRLAARFRWTDVAVEEAPKPR